MANIFQKQIAAETPSAHADQRIYVYVPPATSTSKGIAQYDTDEFVVNNGLVKLHWSQKTLLEDLSDPLENISNVKLLDSEFEYTGNTATVTNPITGEVLSSSTAEVQLLRSGRTPLSRPDLVMLSTNDFTESTSNGYKLHSLKVNDPLSTPALVQLNTQDFNQENSLVVIDWPLAHSGLGTTRTNGYGLVKIATNSAGSLRYSSDGYLEVNSDSILATTSSSNSISVEYEGNSSTSFTLSDWVDSDGLALRNDNNNNKLAINRSAVGLDRVLNKSFSEWTYPEFGTAMKNHFNEEFASKLDVTMWNLKFGDWNPPTMFKETPQLWLTELDGQDEALWDTISTIDPITATADDSDTLNLFYIPSGLYFGRRIYVVDTSTYWTVRAYLTTPNDEGISYYVTSVDSLYNISSPTDEAYALVVDRSGSNNDSLYQYDDSSDTWLSAEFSGGWEWYDTEESAFDTFFALREDDPTVIRPNGTATVGSSGKWLQSNHVHPTDTTRLAHELYSQTNISVTSDFESDSSFNVDLYEENESGAAQPNRTLNIPYIRKSQYLTNWQGMESEFSDSEASNETYWAGTQDEYLALTDIADNSLLIVEDDYEEVSDSWITYDMLDEQGASIGISRDTLVTIDPSLDVGRLMIMTDSTSTSGNTRRRLANLEFSNAIVGTSRFPVVTKSISGTGTSDIIIDNLVLTANRCLETDENGGMQASIYHNSNVIKSNNSSTETILSSGYLVESDGNNTLKTKDLGIISNIMIVTDGLGNIQKRTSTSINRSLYQAGNAIYDGPRVDNILTTDRTSDSVIRLTPNTLLKSGELNTIVSIENPNLQGQVLTSSSLGPVFTSFETNRLMYSNSNGVLDTFPTTSSDNGKYFGVSNTGAPTLITPLDTGTISNKLIVSDGDGGTQVLLNDVNGVVYNQSGAGVNIIESTGTNKYLGLNSSGTLAYMDSHDTLPITTTTTAPTIANSIGRTLCVLDADPGTYVAGVLYLW